MTSDTFPFQAVDFHCHIDLHPDPPAQIATCDQKKVLTLAVTTTPKAWTQNLAWTAQSRYVQAAVGLHPELAGDRLNEVELLERYIDETHFVGEVGLDGSTKYRSIMNAQREVFVRALKRAQKLGGRVFSVHSRGAADEVVRLLAEHSTADRVLPILHWFSGTQAVARRAITHGCYFSINSKMLKSKAGVALIQKLPLDRLLIETDAPFISLNSDQSTASQALQTIESLSMINSGAHEKIRQAVLQNTQKVCHFGGWIPKD